VSSLREILEAAGDQIRDTMEAEADWDIQVESSMILNPTPPAIDMYPADPATDIGTGSFGETYPEIDEGWRINFRARVAPNDNVANQEVLLELMDPESPISLVQSLYDDPTLGGHAADLTLEQTSGFVLVPKVDGSAVHIGVVWRFLVIPARS
jgi:hypothetical protein